ncbi:MULTISPECIES: hypothetical protein [Amycolatopsis]|nr:MULTISPECIES: hypothetical protein [Amycolatopsis]MYW92491.1 hypothetical protein [Amycolatopsis rubida]
MGTLATGAGPRRTFLPDWRRVPAAIKSTLDTQPTSGLIPAERQPPR